jgi:type II secretory pathway component PulC
MAIDLNRLHHAVHQITGDMALRWNKADARDLERWARVLRTIAQAMDVLATRAGKPDDACKDR